MPPASIQRDFPLSMRLPRDDVDLIDRAAALRGRSRTDFIREAAVRAAEVAVLETSPLRMSPEGFEAFLAAISSPGVAAPEMVEILRRPSPWTND